MAFPQDGQPLNREWATQLAQMAQIQFPDGEGGFYPISQQQISLADAGQKMLALFDKYGANSTLELPPEIRQQMPNQGIYTSQSPKTFGGQLKAFVTNPAFLVALGGVAGVAGAGAGAAGAGAGSGTGTAAGLTAAEEAAMLGAASTGGGATAAGTSLGAATMVPAASGGGATLGTGISAAAPATGAGMGLGSGITTGGAAATGTGAGMASGTGGFLGLSTGDWVNLGTQLGGAVLQSGAAKDASRDQTAASNAAIAESRRQFDTTRSDLAPWMQTGSQAISRVGDLLGISGNTLTPEQVMAMDPGYQFRLGEGEQAIDRAASARGLNKSGATLKALTRFGQDYASGEYGNIYNRLAGAASGGQQAATNVGQLGAGNAQNIGSLLTGAANARGAAGIGAANAWGGALSNIGNWYNQNQTLDKILNSQGGYGGLYGR